MTKLDKITNVELRSVFPNESSDFTVWLSNQENLELLGKSIGINLLPVKREAPVVNFRVDLLAKDSESNYVIIENQLTESDHDHLGKLITYCSHYNSKIVIWIVQELRIEHEKAINWLNHNTSIDISFFIVKFELIKIGESMPAPKFTLIVKPSVWNVRIPKTKEVSKPKEEILPITEEELNQKIEKKSFIEFLENHIIIGQRYPKRNSLSGEIGLLNEYERLYPKDCLFFEKNPALFRKYMELWAECKGFEINKKYKNDKYKGYHRSNGSDYYTFTLK